MERSKSSPKTVHRVLTKLQNEGFTVNPWKCEWAAEETEYLGFILTQNGIKPIPKKVEAMKNISRSTNVLINYYRDMWPRRAHILTL